MLNSTRETSEFRSGVKKKEKLNLAEIYTGRGGTQGFREKRKEKSWGNYEEEVPITGLIPEKGGSSSSRRAINHRKGNKTRACGRRHVKKD